MTQNLTVFILIYLTYITIIMYNNSNIKTLIIIEIFVI